MATQPAMWGHHVITERGLAALRSAAALAHALPPVRLRLRAGDRVLADVARPPFPAGAAVPVLAPCGFRNAVARAWDEHRRGSRLRFLDLADGVDPAVDVGVPAPSAVLAGGIVRVGLERSWVHAVAVPRPLADCLGIVGDLACGDLGGHHDHDLGVTLLHTHAPVGDPVAERRALDVLAEAVSRCAVVDLEELLETMTTG